MDMKRPFQPPPNKAARIANSINLKNYKPGMTGSMPKIEPPKARRKPPKANGSEHHWLFDMHQKATKAKRIEKAAEIILRQHREKVRQKLSDKLFDMECRMELKEVWEE